MRLFIYFACWLWKKANGDTTLQVNKIGVWQLIVGHTPCTGSGNKESRAATNSQLLVTPLQWLAWLTV